MGEKLKDKAPVPPTIGSEIIRVDFNSGIDEVTDLKREFAKLYDKLTNRVISAQNEMEKTPAIMSDESIRAHMEIVRKNEELMRCMSEACKLLEQSAMFAVKAITA